MQTQFAHIWKQPAPYSETTGVFAETIALANFRPKSMARHYLRIPAQHTFFHACLPRQNTPQSNPLAAQALNIAKNCIFSTVEIQGVEKTERTPQTVPILVRGTLPLTQRRPDNFALLRSHQPHDKTSVFPNHHNPRLLPAPGPLVDPAATCYAAARNFP